MTLSPRGTAAGSAMSLDEIEGLVRGFAPEGLEPWEAGYLAYHRRRFQDTVALLGDGAGRRLLDVGTFPGHLAALARARGWEVAGLNSDIESGDAYDRFLRRCAARQIAMASCNVERDPFPFADAAFDAVLFSELFEHLCFNPFHTLREIFRVLRPGGILVLTTPNVRRIETLARLLHGWGYQPPVSRTFHELLPSLLHHRHNREYTGNELRYFLSLQGKDLHDFAVERLCYSDCLDGAPEIPGILGQSAGRAEATVVRLLQRTVPSLRGQIMVRAVRSGATFVPWDGLGALAGLGPSREDELPRQGFTRRVSFPLRPTASRVAFDVPIPSGEGPALVCFMAAHLGPDDSPVLDTLWRVDGNPVMTLAFRPTHRAVRVRLLVPAVAAARGTARIELETGTWHDPLVGGPAGPHLGGPGITVERLCTPAAIAGVFARAHAEDRAEERQAPVLAAARSMVVVHPGLRSALEIGPREGDELGGGWFPREKWGRGRWVRWTSSEATAYLACAREASSLNALLCPGDQRLGPATGELIVERAGDGGFFREQTRVPFELAKDAWTTVVAPLSAGAGTVRVTVRVPQPRVPREHIAGAADDRALGVAVRRLWLA